MTMVDGRFEANNAEQLLNVLVNNARSVFGDDLNDDEEAVIRMFYVPVANLLSDVQQDIALVLDSAQLDFAEGKALDLLVALIGISRKPGRKATGEVTFSRASAASVDYPIPKGTVVQTDAVDAVRFETTETATLSAGSVEAANVAIEAREVGPDGNVGSNSIKVMTDPPAGIEAVTNPVKTDDGRDPEDDDDLRARARDELSDGMRATARAVRNELLKTEDVKSVTLFINDTESTDADGLKSHHTEAVVEGGTDANVGQTICDTKGAGDGTQGGLRGTKVSYDADIGNGQTLQIDFSRPTGVQIYVDISLDTNANYEGDDAVKDALVNYIGGTLSSGNEENGDLRVDDDVIYTKALAAIHSVDGIDDVPSLEIGKTSSPTGTSNVSISNTEVATADATDSSITITVV